MKLNKLDILFIVLVLASLATGVAGLIMGEKTSTLALIVAELTILVVFGLYLRERGRATGITKGTRR